MSGLNSKRKKRDGNHSEIVKHFESIGFHVLTIADIPKCCDLVITKGRSAYVEIKDGSLQPSQRKLTPDEFIFKKRIEEKGGLWFLVETIQDVNNIYMKFNSFE